MLTNLNPNKMNKLFPGIVNNKELGKLKLESILIKEIFIASKYYILQTVEDKFIYKIKRLINKIDININDFNTLLSQIIKKN